MIYSGLLSAYPTSYAAGIVDPLPGRRDLDHRRAHVYRFSVTLISDNQAQGKSATAGFTWEARNL